MLEASKFKEILTVWDYIVFFLMLFMTFAFILYGHYRGKVESKNENFLDLMLMGRRLTLPIFTATLVATWYGGIFGVAEIAFNNGIYNFVTQGIFWYLTYFIFAFFIVEKIRPFNAVTLPDLVGKMFGKKSEKLAAIFNILNLVPVAYCISIGLFIKMMFGLNLEFSIILGVLTVLSYSLIGGFRSVVYSDIFQFFIMTFSVFLVFAFSYGIYGLSPLLSLPDSYFNPLGTSTLGETISWGLIALGTLVDPNFYQRCFAAKNFTVAKRGILLSTVIWIFFDLCLTLGAMYAKAIMPEAVAKEGYFLYALNLLPVGLKGFFLAGICATILSTLDSYLFLAGSTIAYDLTPKKYKEKPFVLRLGIIVVGIVSIVLSFTFDGNIKDVWKTLGSISSAALLAPIIYAHLTKKKIHDMSFVISASLGAFATILWRLTPAKDYFALDEIYIGVVCSSLGLYICSFIYRNDHKFNHF